jgi:hypothetical protein
MDARSSLSRATSLLRREFFEVDMHYGEKVVVVRRTPVAFRSVADIDATIDAFARAVPLERRKGHALLVDTRASPIAPDPSLEPAFKRYRVEVERGFARIVVVVTSVIGKMRSARLMEVAEVPFVVVNTVDEAWVVLREPG